MSNAGVFQIVTNDGKQDRMLMATQLLKRRLEIIEAAREKDPMIADKTPTLLDIEKTHILFMNASFKPFAAIGFEYQRVTAEGSASYGNTIKFSLPTFGDFIGDMVLHVTLAAPTVVRPDIYPSYLPAFRWCHFPGERLLQQVRFMVANNELDSYSSASINMYREISVKPNKKNTWYRSVGQELPISGWIPQASTPLNISTNPDLSTNSGVTGTTDYSDLETFRSVQQILSGPQTPVWTPKPVDLWIPLLFWFNLDPRLMLPSVALPNTNRNVEFTFAESSKMYGLVPRGGSSYGYMNGTIADAAEPFTACELYVNNLFVQPEVHDIFIKRIGFTLVRVHREHQEEVSASSDNKLLNSLKWPIEAMFIGMRVVSYGNSVADIDKWHYFSRADTTAYKTQSIKNGATAFTVTGTDFTIAFGTLTLTGGQFTDELSVGDTLSIAGHICMVTSIDSTNSCGISPSVDMASSTAVSPITKLASVTAHAHNLTTTIDKLSISAHGVQLYNMIDSKFYSNYLPFRYSDQNGSDDPGILSIFFCLYPGSYQPSGHVNVSRAREFYLNYQSSVCSSTIPCTLIVVASALNFLLISDGSAVLRYTT